MTRSEIDAALVALRAVTDVARVALLPCGLTALHGEVTSTGASLSAVAGMGEVSVRLRAPGCAVLSTRLHTLRQVQAFAAAVHRLHREGDASC